MAAFAKPLLCAGRFISNKLKLIKMDNQTKFYTEGFGEVIAVMDGIIYLNKGDDFLGKNGEHYTIVWKVYNPFLDIMIYHGKLTVEALK